MIAPKWDISQVSTNGRMNKQSVVNLYNGLLLKNEQTADKHKIMDESQKYFEQKADTEGKCNIIPCI